MSWEVFQDGTSWDQLIYDLGGQTPFQFCAWAQHKIGFGWKAIRLVKKNEKQVTGAIQLLVKEKGPLKIVWAPGGPVGSELKGLAAAVGKNISGPYYLRINPQREFHDEAFTKCRVRVSAKQTLILDLTPELEQLQKNLSQNWRHNLKRSQKAKVEASLFELSALEIYQLITETENIKALKSQFTLPEINSIAKNFGLLTSVARYEGQTISFRSAIAFKDLAWDIFAATSALGREKYASNLATWQLLTEAKARGIKRYDFMGVDPVRNSGVYNFKKGLGTKLLEMPDELEASSFKPINWVLNSYLRGRSL